MKKIPPNRVLGHADFDSTPLGGWATSRDAAKLTAGGQRVQRLTDIQTLLCPLASVKFEEAALILELAA